MFVSKRGAREGGNYVIYGYLWLVFCRCHPLMLSGCPRCHPHILAQSSKCHPHMLAALSTLGNTLRVILRYFFLSATRTCSLQALGATRTCSLVVLSATRTCSQTSPKCQPPIGNDLLGVKKFFCVLGKVGWGTRGDEKSCSR